MSTWPLVITDVFSRRRQSTHTSSCPGWCRRRRSGSPDSSATSATTGAYCIPPVSMCFTTRSCFAIDEAICRIETGSGEREVDRVSYKYPTSLIHIVANPLSVSVTPHISVATATSMNRHTTTKQHQLRSVVYARQYQYTAQLRSVVTARQ